MRISVDEARAFWDHPSQTASPDELPDDPVYQYWAVGGVCGVFHPLPWPGVWLGHYGVKPNVWGKSIAPARQVIAEFLEAEKPERLMGWTKEENRAAISFARRLGFVECGAMHLPTGNVIMQEFDYGY